MEKAWIRPRFQLTIVEDALEIQVFVWIDFGFCANGRFFRRRDNFREEVVLWSELDYMQSLLFRDALERTLIVQTEQEGSDDREGVQPATVFLDVNVLDSLKEVYALNDLNCRTEFR